MLPATLQRRDNTETRKSGKVWKTPSTNDCPSLHTHEAARQSQERWRQDLDEQDNPPLIRAIWGGSDPTRNNNKQTCEIKMNLTGDWRLNLESPFGMQTPILTLVEEEGSRFRGELKGQMGNVKFKNGIMDGNNLSWELKMKAMMLTVKLTCTALIEENRINGKMSSKMGVYNFTGEYLSLDSPNSKVVSGYEKAKKNLEMELNILNSHKEAVIKAKKYSGQKGLRINAGSGYNSKEGWICIDMSADADLQLDLRELMPFEDESAAIVYSEHFFEHLEYPDEACTFLSESYRILEKGGEFSVGVPDTEWPVRSYVNGDDEYFEHARSSFRPPWCKTRMQSVNFHFRQLGDHKYAYDYETLELVLSEAGFTDIRKRPFDPDVDNASRRKGTLYVSAFKPT